MRSLVCLSLLFLGSAPALAWEPVAPVSSHVVTTHLRSLRGCPRKHVISSRSDWDRVVKDLAGAPPPPDFERSEVLLIVTDEAGGADSHVSDPETDGEGQLRLVLTRRQPDLGERAEPSLTVHVFVVPRGVRGLRLDIRTSLGESGFVQRPVRPAASDHDPSRLPLLGPDIRLSWRAPGGSQPALVQLRIESTFPDRAELPARASGRPFEGQTLGMRFPRIRDGVRHVLAAHAPGLRSANALVLRDLPASDGSGSPEPITHTFLLEPVPGSGR